VKAQVAKDMAAVATPRRPMSGLAKSTARARTLVLHAVQMREITRRKITGYGPGGRRTWIGPGLIQGIR
jgi:hypothetical protein